MGTKPTQGDIHNLLAYDPETGIFTWKINPRRGPKVAGRVAGTVGSRGYRQINVMGARLPAHHLAILYVTGAWPKAQVDHRNLNKGDNRFSNLREATARQNSRNRPLRKDSSTGLKGVKPFEDIFQARIETGSKRISLGLFDCKAAAHFAYVIAADKYHGEFARAS